MSGGLRQSDMFKVALVGHSLIPGHLEVPGCDVRCFRAPGGRARSFYHDYRMSQVLDWQHHLTILYLGGNDIHPEVQPREISDNLFDIIHSIEHYCGSKVSVVLLEPRQLPLVTRGLSRHIYRTIYQAVNRRLQRLLRGYQTFQFGARPYRSNLRRDGIHWNRTAQAAQIARYHEHIEQQRDQWRVYQAMAVGEERNYIV